MSDKTEIDLQPWADELAVRTLYLDRLTVRTYRMMFAALVLAVTAVLLTVMVR